MIVSINAILVDEMHMKEDLVYNKSTGNSYMGMMHTSYDAYFWNSVEEDAISAASINC